MIKYKNKKVIEKKINYVICDVCGKKYTDTLEIQEIARMDHNCGFNSIFGDGSEIELEICQYCIKDKLGKYLRIKKGMYID